MKRFRGVNYLLCLISLVGVLSLLLGSQIALAATESSNPPLPPLPNEEEPAEEPIKESLELVCRFPVKQGESGGSFEFEVSLNYQGTERKTFEFSLDTPQGWDVAITRYYGGEEGEIEPTILAMVVEPNLAYPEKAIITLNPLPGYAPEVGDYVLTFEVASGGLRDSIELKAVVTSLPLTYELKFVTANGRLDAPVKGGEDNYIPLKITNTGSGVLTNLSFTSVKSEGWGTIFAPNQIGSLEPGESVDAEVVMTPPRNTIAGDYRVLVRVGADSPIARLQEQLDMRIRVQTPTIWGAAGIGIVVAVIAALAIMFRQLGRR
jgi:uncharacterized membrane protein